MPSQVVDGWVVQNRSNSSNDRWYTLWFTASFTRSGAIHRLDHRWGDGEKYYAKYRKKGQLRCVRATTERRHDA